MDGEFFNAVKNYHNVIIETAGVVVENDEFLDKGLRTKYLNILEKSLTNCITCEHKVAILRQAIKEVVSRAKNDTTEEFTSSQFEEMVEESIGELEVDSPLEEALTQSQSLVVFKEQTEQHNGENTDTDDIVTTECTTSLIDPISKKMMKNPVRNKLCGHVYDKASVMSMISAKTKNGFKCPTIGCNNRRIIKETDLENAPDVKRQIKLSKKQNVN